MANLNWKEVIQLAQEVGGNTLVNIIKENLDVDNIQGARLKILGYLDAYVLNGGPILPEKAAEYYSRLSFTTDEMVGFRQRNLT